uniref:Retrotransposon Copia-like N-terminal domain-containing protein n=2 Tax=Opuntia streptacantha TaxID=393608 RepID=A0A7C8YMN2_OPUST
MHTVFVIYTINKTVLVHSSIVSSFLALAKLSWYQSLVFSLIPSNASNISCDMSTTPNSTHDPHNPLFIHPSDGPNTITLAEKLTGSDNYRSWKRSMEISLSTKRKLAFVQGTLAKSVDDPQKADQWEACNNMVIAWIMNNVSDSIARSILYVKTAAEIWLQLDKRFAIANGSRKYNLLWSYCGGREDRAKGLTSNR